MFFNVKVWICLILMYALISCLAQANFRHRKISFKLPLLVISMPSIYSDDKHVYIRISSGKIWSPSYYYHRVIPNPLNSPSPDMNLIALNAINKFKKRSWRLCRVASRRLQCTKRRILQPAAIIKLRFHPVSQVIRCIVNRPFNEPVCKHVFLYGK